MKNGIILGDDGKGNLLLSNEDGLFESHDNGETWEQWIPEIIDFAPVIHAEWFKSDYDDYICTNCFVYSKNYHNYCPHCGAKMDKEVI